MVVCACSSTLGETPVIDASDWVGLTGFGLSALCRITCIGHALLTCLFTCSATAFELSFTTLPLVRGVIPTSLKAPSSMADSPICFVYSVAQCTFTMCLLVKTTCQHCSPSIMISTIEKLPQTDIVVDHALTDFLYWVFYNLIVQSSSEPPNHRAEALQQ